MRALADVARAFVHRFEEAFEALAKDIIALRAAEATGFFEVCLREAAIGALRFAAAGGLFHFLRGAEAEEQIGEREASRIVNAFRLGATFTEVHFLRFPFDHLGQVNGCYVLFTNVAEHFDRFYIGPAPPQVKETLSRASGSLTMGPRPPPQAQSYTGDEPGKSGVLPHFARL